MFFVSYVLCLVGTIAPFLFPLGVLCSRFYERTIPPPFTLHPLIASPDLVRNDLLAWTYGNEKFAAAKVHTFLIPHNIFLRLKQSFTEYTSFSPNPRSETFPLKSPFTSLPT